MFFFHYSRHRNPPIIPRNRRYGSVGRLAPNGKRSRTNTIGTDDVDTDVRRQLHFDDESSASNSGNCQNQCDQENDVHSQNNNNNHNNIPVTMTTGFTTAAAFGMYPTSMYIVVRISGKKKIFFSLQ